MATTPKKRSKKSKVTPTASSVESLSQLRKTITSQEKTIASQARELRQAAEQQAATSEILRVISSSPTDLQPVLDAVATNAARLCDAADAVVYRVDGDMMHPVAIHGTLGASTLPLNRGSVTGQAVAERQEIHVYQETTDLDTEFRSPQHGNVSVGC